MLYAQFYQTAAYPAGTTEIIEACGDRAVIIYDARVMLQKTLQDAEEECRKRGYKAYALFRGESFTRSKIVTPIMRIE